MSILESLFFVLISAFAGYAVQKLERIEVKLGVLEDDLTLLKTRVRLRRKGEQDSP